MNSINRGAMHPLLLSIASIAASLVVARPAQAIPLHDNCGGAVNIASFPYTEVGDTTSLNQQAADPLPSCGNGSENLWYRLQSASRVSVRITTEGSDYDTVIAAHRGSCGMFIELGCNAEIPGGSGDEAEMIVPLDAGEVVFVQVGSNSGNGGNLVLNIDEADPEHHTAVSLEEIILSSDANPLGGTFAELRTAVALTRRDIGFASRQYAVFQRDAGGAIVTVASSGSPSPVGGVFSKLGEPSINANGTIAFYGRVNGGAVEEGVFGSSGAGVFPMVLKGQAAPGGGNFSQFGEDVALNNNGDLVFRASAAALPVLTEDLYTINVGTGVGALLAQIFANHPCAGGGGVIRDIGSRPRGFDVADNAPVVTFYAKGSDGDGILAASPGIPATAIACEDGPAPGGGTYRNLNREPAIDALGDVYFSSDITGGIYTSGLWRRAPNGPPAIAMLVDGWLLASGQTVESVTGDVAASSNGVYAVVGRVVGDGAAIIADAPALPGPSAIVAAGVTPGCPGGGSWLRFSKPEIDGTGQLVFVADCASGSGVFHKNGTNPTNAVADTQFVSAVGAGFLPTLPEVNAAGDLSFRGWRKSAFVARCNSVSCAPAISVASSGDALAGLPGSHIDDIDTLTLNGASKRLAVLAKVAGGAGDIRDAVLTMKGGGVDVVALEGDPLPGAVGTFANIQNQTGNSDLAVPAADKSTIAFVADVEGHPTGSTGLFVWTKQGLGTVVMDGDLAPNGGTFSSFNAPVVRKRNIVFVGTGSGFSCVYKVRRAGDPLDVVVCDGDSAPLPFDGTFSLHKGPPSGTSKHIYFGAYVSGAISGSCVFKWTKGTIDVVRCEDDPYIYGNYHRYLDLLGPSNYPAAEQKGKGAVYVSIMDLPDDTVLLAERKGSHYRLLHRFDTIGPSSGGNIRWLPHTPPSMNKKTVVVATELGNSLLADWSILRMELD